MIPSATRLDIINDRFAYTDDEIITVNASQLCEEIIAHDRLKTRVAYLENRIEFLSSLLHPTDM
jgi:anti-sigma factor RsiW